MRATELKAILEELGYPVTNTSFPPNFKQDPPFIVFLRNNINTFDADDVVYTYDFEYYIELYTCRRDEDMEEKLIGILDKHKINWSFVSDSRIQEGLYLTVFAI